MNSTEQQPQSCQTDVSSSAYDDTWTCGCLYKCNNCLKVESEWGNKRDFFEKIDLDYWDE